MSDTDSSNPSSGEHVPPTYASHGCSSTTDPGPVGSCSGRISHSRMDRGRRARRGAITLFSMIPAAITLLVGVLGGIGVFTFTYGSGWSYLSNNPQTCANCHVMQDHFDAWQHSSHQHVAVCNDCHLPDHPLGKWITKADNGFFHSLAFTLENFHEPIQIKPRNRRVAQRACLACHADFVHEMFPATPAGEMLSCVHCHRDVGHALR